VDVRIRLSRRRSDLATHEEGRSLSAFGNFRYTQTRSIGRQSLSLVEFSQRAVRVHFEVDQFGGVQSKDYLPLVRGRSDDLGARRAVPVMDYLAGQNVTKTMRMDLQ
jgi:hypothetical protein